jgi:hypothetical protein
MTSAPWVTRYSPALDIYWAYFLQGVRPLPDDVNPMPRGLRMVYEAGKPLMAGALDPILVTHRDAIFKDHIGLPLTF